MTIGIFRDRIEHTEDVKRLDEELDIIMRILPVPIETALDCIERIQIIKKRIDDLLKDV